MSTTTAPPTTTAAVYVRISSDPKGERAGVERQRTDCERLAADLGVTDVRLYEDNDVSAFSGATRPAFTQMLADVESGVIGTVIVWAVDRLYRRLTDLETIVSVLDNAGVSVHAVKSGDIDLSTADGRLHARLLGSVAIHTYACRGGGRVRRGRDGQVSRFLDLEHGQAVQRGDVEYFLVVRGQPFDAEGVEVF